MFHANVFSPESLENGAMLGSGRTGETELGPVEICLSKAGRVSKSREAFVPLETFHKSWGS